MSTQWPVDWTNDLFTARRAVGFAMAVLLAVGSAARAQLPGVPVLQNGWANPGAVIAFNVGGGGSRSAVALAAAWSPMERVQLSGGVGYQSGSWSGRGGAYGLRVAIPLSSVTSQLGFAVLAGVGGTGSHRTTIEFPFLVDSVTSSTELPVGAAIGWKRGRFSLYTTPSYVFFDGGSDPGGLFRIALGADIGIGSSWGLTAGTDFGGTRPAGAGGPTGARYGFGISYLMTRQ